MVRPLELPELEMKPYGDSSSDMKNIKIPGMANFEEAMQLAGYGRFQLRAVTCSALCLLSVIVDGMSLGYLLPAAQCDLHMTFSQKGLLSSTGFIGFICSAHLWGAVGDMYGRRKTMMLALYLNSVCSSTSALAPTYATMLCLRFLSGFFSCGPAGLLYAYAGEFHDNVRRPRCVLMVSAISAVVSLLLPTLGWLVIPIPMRLPLPFGLPDLTSWRLFLALSGVFSFSAATALCLAMPESPKFLLENEQHGDALSVFRKVFAINTGRAESEYPVHALQSEKEESSGSDHGGKPQETRHSMLVKIWEQTAPLFGAKLRSTTALISILMCCSYIGFQPLIMWGPEMFNRLSSASTTVTLCEVMQHTSPVLNSTLVLLSEAADFVLESWEYNATSFQPLIMWGPEMFNRLSSASTTVNLCEVMQHTSPVLNSTLVLLSEAADFVLESWEYNATSKCVDYHKKAYSN
ncbi:hypothetical protein B566_EDAN011503 [Ephemera danica]|nr:hypothetical protein B566_EDAN011503 [Ephemera danica]